jgi:hypothetical protein
VSRIRVEPFTDDPEGIRAITDYWAQDDDLTFTHRVRTVAAMLGLRERDVVRLVTQFSRACVPDWPCGACGGIRPLPSRAWSASPRKPMPPAGQKSRSIIQGLRARHAPPGSSTVPCC